MDELVARARAALELVTDPEIPQLNLRELGVLRDVRASAEGLEIVLTPTYSGCPALDQIEQEVRAKMAELGLPARITRQLVPAWSSDWLGADARAKLRAAGIAPPQPAAGGAVVHFTAPRQAPLPCPRCGSGRTETIAPFGSTACKALHRCLDCGEPFDYFKPY
ncbi:MAG: phenylacetate-CoA oxygenase subunit PaaJ [Rhodocyclaceae bacterium]|nr:phenylacetate-CoA oxygenase subunit PaaJ [Rhodocyclaceae bacterium]